MSGSQRYLGALESLHAMFGAYPTQAEIESVQLLAAGKRVTVTVWLRRAEPEVLAAGLVDWHRTLAQAETLVWREPDGDGVHLVVVGFGTACELTPVAVVAGPIPCDRYLDEELEPGLPELVSAEDLHSWLGTEVTRAWPFTNEGEIR